MSKAGESQAKTVKESSDSSSFAPESPDERWLTVERILDSRTFRRSPRLKELLRFLAEQTMAGCGDQLTESEIGRLVFERGENYIPTIDSIVRSSARQLRIKLQEFYTVEGQSEPWVVEIPKGAYIVQFRQRSSSDAEAPPLDLVNLNSPQQPATLQPHTHSLQVRRIGFGIAAVVLLCSLALNVWYWTRDRSTKAAVQPRGLLGSLVMSNHRSPRPTQFVLDDYAYVLMSSSGSAGRRYSLDGYANREYVNPEFAPTRDPAFLHLWNLLSTRYLVSYGATAALEHALRAVPQQDRLVVRHARTMAVRDFKEGNFILFGSPPNNPWAMFFEDKLNFQKTGAGFVNRHPQPGEQPLYSPTKVFEANSGVAYTRLAYLPNSENGFVLLLTGLNMVTSEAAAEFAADPARIPEILRITGAKSIDSVPHFEMLLEVSAVDTTPKDIRLIAYRKVD